ncbi:MAG: oxidoreductase [Opitutaceae bacterium]|nr:oxidoreductase [Opitutaceae bacterium]|tara:strand:+ start:880 stop:1860 length:981 start_codon:yes stop_codon:yes gene_type:complete
MSKIRWGIIGVGDVCEIKSGPGFRKASNSELVAVMRRNGDMARDYAERHGVPKWSDNADTLLSDSGIDAIYIATPPVYHLEYTQAVLAAGKHAYIEKPVAMNTKEAQLIAEADNASAQKVCIAHYRRKLPLFLEIERILESGELGRPRHVNLQLIQQEKSDFIADTDDNWRVRPEVSGGGLFHDLAPHQFDLLLKYFGNPEVMQGFSLKRNPNGTCDDCVSGQMRFGNDVLFQGYWDFSSKGGTVKEICSVTCDEGLITFSFFRNSILVIKSNKGIKTTNYDPPEHIAQPMIEAVNDYFLEKAENPCNSSVGVKVMNMIDAFITHR